MKNTSITNNLLKKPVLDGFVNVLHNIFTAKVICNVDQRGQTDLRILAEHAEPEDRCPRTLLLARVGDNDHRKGGGLHIYQDRFIAGPDPFLY